MEEKLNSLLIKAYLDALQDIYTVTKIPIIIVEGWGRTNNLLRHYDFCYHLEEKWIESITGLKHPIITTIQTYEAVIDHFGKSLEIGRRDRLLKNYERFHERLKATNVFPDGGHPSYKHHKELFDKLEPVIDSIPKYKLPEINYEEHKKYYRHIL